MNMQSHLQKVKFKNDSSIVFISICTSTNKEEWIKAIHSNVYTSNNVINLYTGGMGNNHPMISFYNINSTPKPMLIGKDGKIVTTNANELGHAIIPSSEKLINSITATLK